MRRSLVLLALLGALVAPTDALADETIALVAGSAGFRPNSVTVRAGERVVFRNDDRIARRVVGDHDEFSTALLRPGRSAVVRFDNIGTVGFRDAVDPDRRGAVVVVVAPHTISIHASSAVLASAGFVLFSGRISPARRGERIELLRVERDGSVNILDSTVTRRDGRWSLSTTVGASGVYRARWERVESRPLRVRVRAP